ncbi:MAG TPA: T9SS type B sorting domain-containing protein [Flavobacteriaceae bacterium]|nr:T9SS type B sorting domain-containing protein [Flavobacteriaceae bacterium]
MNPIPASEGLEINIFDRYGKLLATVGNPGLSWDGTYNGKEMQQRLLVQYLIHQFTHSSIH